MQGFNKPAAFQSTQVQPPRKMIETQRVAIDSSTSSHLYKKPEFSKTSTSAVSEGVSIQSALKKSVLKPNIPLIQT